MRKSRSQMVHDFFYTDEPATSKDGRTRVEGGAFFSYDTCIAQKFNFGKGPVLVIMLDRISHTTDQHRSLLEDAVPPGWTVLQYPYPGDMEHAYPAQTVDRMVKCLKSEIASYSERDMRSSGKRKRFREIAKTLRYLLENAGVDEPAKDAVLEKAGRLEKACLKGEASLAKLRGTLEDQKAKGVWRGFDKTPWHEALEAFGPHLASFMKAPVMEAVKEVFTSTRKRKWLPATPRAKAVAKRLLTTNGFVFRKPLYGGDPVPEPRPFMELPEPDGRSGDLAFAWVAGDRRTVRTSMGVQVSLNHVKAAYRNYDSLEDKASFEGYLLAGRYAVGRVGDGLMVIGCHKIPLEAVEALRAEVFRDEEQKGTRPDS